MTVGTRSGPSVPEGTRTPAPGGGGRVSPKRVTLAGVLSGRPVQ